jgi:thioredoxin reductase (NADPH)
MPWCGAFRSMSSYLSSRLEADPGTEIDCHTDVAALHGDSHLEGVTFREARTGKMREIAARTLFIMVGAAPSTDWLLGLAALDEKGFLRTGPTVGAASPFATSRPGIFAAGNIRTRSVKRAASATDEGSVVVSKVSEYLNPKPPVASRKLISTNTVDNSLGDLPGAW